MEICTRYYNFFEDQQRYIPQVLENFVRLVHHDHVRIRTRSWYLFQRFVKMLRAQVGNVAKTVIESISDLLPIKAEVPGNDADDDMSSDESDHSADAVFSSQLYLYEAIGCISSTSATPPADQGLYARSVMEPLFSDMSVHMERAKTGDAQAVLQVHHIIMALGTLANGFAEAHPAHTRPQPHEAVSNEFSRAAEAILIALNQLNAIDEIRTACRSAFSRLLGVLGAAVLPQLPQWIEGLLSRSSSKDEMAMFLRLLEQVVYNFKTEIYNILDVLLTPLLQRVFSGLSEPINGTDDEIQLQELRREYVSFVQVILLNDLGGVLVSAANQATFESLVSSIINIAKTLTHGNLVPSRIAFNVLSRMASQWGGPDVVTIGGETPTTTGAPPAPAIPGFDQFMIEHFHGLCWTVLQDAGFRPNTDAQSRQILNEIAGIQQVIYAKTGDAFVGHLQGVTFPQLGIDGTEYLRVLTTARERKPVVGWLLGLLKGRR
jgi:exportin-T